MRTQDEIKAAIEFYESRGWDWLAVVSFISARATGHWPLPKGWVMYRKKVKP